MVGSSTCGHSLLRQLQDSDANLLNVFFLLLSSGLEDSFQADISAMSMFIASSWASRCHWAG